MSNELGVQLRLSDDGQRLELFLPIEALRVPTDTLLDQVRRQSASLQLKIPLRAEDLRTVLRKCDYGSWFHILECVPPTPPVDEQVELLVPVALRGQHARGASQAVRSGTPLARLRPGRPGRPGLDLRMGLIPARAARRARLPQGENTHVSDDGTLLLASCDGEVVLRQMALHVLPGQVQRGDITVADGPIRSSTAISVQGNVRAGAVVEAEGDIHIAGDVEAAIVSSRQGSIIVTGSITGTSTHQAQLQAQTDIRCRAAQHATLEAAQDLYLQATARRCTLRVGRNIYLEQTLVQSLRQVALTVGGGVLPQLPEVPELVAVTPDAERQHVRVSASLAAQFALHSVPPLTFRSCIVEDLSVGGARCGFPKATPDELPAVGAIIQLKFALHGDAGEVLCIGRVIRLAGRTAIGVAFLQMREHDQELLREFCQDAHRHRALAQMSSRADRRTTPDQTPAEA